MTETSISLLSIVCGIMGSFMTSRVTEKKEISLTGVVMVGVFCSVFFMKVFGRLGFDPSYIMQFKKVNMNLLFINISVSVLSGVLGFYVVSWFKKRFFT